MAMVIGSNLENFIKRRSCRPGDQPWKKEDTTLKMISKYLTWTTGRQHLEKLPMEDEEQVWMEDYEFTFGPDEFELVMENTNWDV